MHMPALKALAATEQAQLILQAIQYDDGSSAGYQQHPHVQVRFWTYTTTEQAAWLSPWTSCILTQCLYTCYCIQRLMFAKLASYDSFPRPDHNHAHALIKVLSILKPAGSKLEVYAYLLYCNRCASKHVRSSPRKSGTKDINIKE